MSTSSQLPSTGDMLVLDTSKPTPLELYSQPVNSEVMVSDPSNAYYSAPVGSETGTSLSIDTAAKFQFARFSSVGVGSGINH